MAQGFCTQSRELLAEIATCPADNMPPFNEDVFRSVIDEVELQHERLSAVFNNALERHQQELRDRNEEDDSQPGALWHGSEAEATEVMVYHTAILRNKRQLMAYTKRRLDLIQELRWTNATLPEHIKASLNPQELKFFRDYSKLLGQYMRSADMGGIGLDLTADPTPPDDPYVQVRVLRDYGDMAFSSGSVKLTRGQAHWLPREEAHSLLMDNVLEIC